MRALALQPRLHHLHHSSPGAAAAGAVSMGRDRDLRTPHAGTWRVAWQDLEEPVERGHLPCRSCSSSRSPESLSLSQSLRKTGLTGDGEEVCLLPRTLRVVGASRALKMHVARTGLEMRLGTLPVPAQLSQQRGAQRRQGCRALP